MGNRAREQCVALYGRPPTKVERIDTLPRRDTESDSEAAAMRERAKDRFRTAVARLPERDRKVAVLLFVHNLTLREIGEILGVTESRVARFTAGSSGNLREQLRADEQLLSEVA